VYDDSDASRPNTHFFRVSRAVSCCVWLSYCLSLVLLTSDETRWPWWRPRRPLGFISFLCCVFLLFFCLRCVQQRPAFVVRAAAIAADARGTGRAGREHHHSA
jgi:hypothetical protein